jgi:hypothetical protein
VTAWTAATALETWVLGQTETLRCLKDLAVNALNLRFNASFWNPVLLWFFLPFLAMTVPLLIAPKPSRTALLFLETATLIGVLITSDLQQRIF